MLAGVLSIDRVLVVVAADDGPRPQTLEHLDILELIGVRLRCPNEREAPLPPYLIQVQGGDLRLSRCHLIGPLGQAPAGFRALVSVGSPNAKASGPKRCADAAAPRTIGSSGSTQGDSVDSAPAR